MKKYVVHYSDYMGDSPYMESVEATDNTEAIIYAMDIDEQLAKEEGFSTEELIESAKESNGDGMPYIMIFSVEDNKVIFG